MKLSKQAKGAIASFVLAVALVAALAVYVPRIVRGPEAPVEAAVTTTTSPPPERPLVEAEPLNTETITPEAVEAAEAGDLSVAAEEQGAPVIVPDDYQFASGASSNAPTWKDIALPMRAPNVGKCDQNNGPEWAAERLQMAADGQLTDEVFWLEYLGVKVPVSYIHGPFAVDPNPDRHFVDCYSNTIEGAVIAALQILARDTWTPDNAFESVVSYSAVPNEGRTNRAATRPEETKRMLTAAAEGGLDISARHELANPQIICVPVGHVGSQAEQSIIVWILQECPVEGGVTRQVLICDMSFEGGTWKIVYPEVPEDDGSLSFPTLCTPRPETEAEKEADLWFYWPEEYLVS